MNRYALRTGEYLAISSDAIRRDSDGFFLMLGGETPANETRGSVVLVNVRGALQQFASPFGDSYEAIESRVAQAFASDPKPSKVVLRISSPGGVVAGLNETIARLRRMSADAGIELVAYVDELAASAAYGICCACDKVYSPPSGVSGSVGVISTMVSIVKHDEAEGIEFRIITSGKRKADGHLHAPISDDAVKAETARNAELASQFFALAGKARKMPPKKLEALEAGIFLGKAAVRAGLVDEVVSLDDLILALDTSEVASTAEPAPNEGNITDRRAQPKKVDASSRNRATQSTASRNSPRSDAMPIKLDALIKKTAAAIATATATGDAKQVASLSAKLAAYQSTRAEMDGDDDKDKKDDDEDGDEESKAEKAAKKAEESDEEEEEAKGKSAEEAASAQRLIESLTGMSGSEALGAIRALAATAAATAKDVAALKARNLDTEKANLIESVAKSSTKAEREFLAGEPLATVRGFVKMRLKSGFVNTTEDALVRPKHVDPTSADALPAETLAMVEQAVAAIPGDAKTKAAFREQLVKAHLAEMNKPVSLALNGAPGRI